MASAGDVVDLVVKLDNVTVPATAAAKITVANASQAAAGKSLACRIPTRAAGGRGGWSHWIDHGQPPTRLRQALPFQLTTSMDFSRTLRCEHAAGNRCGIRNHADDGGGRWMST